MLWAAYGDALGFITELSNAQGVSRRTDGVMRITEPVGWKRRIGGKFGVTIRLPAGCYSDDTQLRLATCRSIRSDGTFDVETFSKIELPIWLSYALGAGRGTMIAANSLKRSNATWNSNFYRVDGSGYTEGGGNGGAMRIQPHVWCAARHLTNANVLRQVIRNAIVTHGHPRGILGAAFHALNLRDAVLCREIPGPPRWRAIIDELDTLPEIISSDEELTFYWLPQWEKQTGQTLRESVSHALEEMRLDAEQIERRMNAHAHTMEAYRELVREIGCMERRFVGAASKTALLAGYVGFAFHERPHEGLVEVVNLLGSDTDTIATMAGAILGVVARCDPPYPVMDQDYLIRESERLYQISEGIPSSNKDYPDLLYWRPPAQQIDVIGKFHDKWAIQGLGYAEEMEIVAEQSGRTPTVWQWFRLEYGQCILLRRRAIPNVLAGNSLPASSETIPDRVPTGANGGRSTGVPVKEETPRTLPLWAAHESGNVNSEPVSVDVASDKAINSDFRPDVVGSLLIELAQQPYGIEKASSFAAIVAKAKRVRLRREQHRGS